MLNIFLIISLVASTAIPAKGSGPAVASRLDILAKAASDKHRSEYTDRSVSVGPISSQSNGGSANVGTGNVKGTQAMPFPSVDGVMMVESAAAIQADDRSGNVAGSSRAIHDEAVRRAEYDGGGNVDRSDAALNPKALGHKFIPEQVPVAQ
jgi:hypothetical protein